MKISKVELKAFRAYKDLEKGTFDFTKEDGSVANFIAIYAPNGFGKTSFFDGVEWCLTNNIYRFIRKHNDNMHLARADQNYLKHKQLILRNKESENIDGFVKISTKEKVYNRQLPKTPKKGSRDFKFDEKETDKDKLYFRDVLLAQDWIDAFLKEDKPENRYEKFITYFGDNELDKYYKNINQLINLNDTEVKNLKKEMEGIQTKLTFELDDSVLENVNFLIKLLIAKKEKISEIDLGFNNVQNIKLNDKIKQRKIEIEDEISTINNISNEIEECSFKLDKYIADIKELDKTKKEISKLKLVENIIKEKDETSTLINNYKIKALKIKRLQQTIVELKGLYPQYSKLLTEIRLKEKEEKQFESTVLELNKSKNKVEKQIIEVKNLIQNLLKQKDSKEHFLKEMPELFEKISNLKEEKNFSQKAILKEKHALSGFEQKLQLLKEKEKDIKQMENDAIENIFTVELINNKEIIKAIDEIEYLFKLKESFVEDQTLLKEQLNLQKNLNSEVKEFITKGARIIEDTKTKSCPLCLSRFENNEELLKKVSNNPALNEIEKKLLDQEIKNNERISENSKRIDTLKNGINEFIKKLKQDNSDQITKIERDIKFVLIKIQTFKEKNEVTAQNLNQLVAQTQNNTKEKLEEKIQQELKNISKEIKDEQIKLDEAEIEKRKQEEILNQTKEKLLNTVKYIEKLKFNKTYVQLENYCLSENVDELNLKYFDKKMLEFTLDLESITERINKENQELILINEKLKNIDESKVGDTKKILQKVLVEIEQEINIFEKMLKNIKITKNRNDKEFYKKEFNNLNLNLKEELANKKELNTQYIKLEALKENVIPYIQQKQLKAQSSNIKEKYLFKKNKVSEKLKEEKENVSKLIHKQVENFFHEKLINQIYEKLDPHPDYKDIKFRCDFTGISPKLNVLVSKKGEELSSSPALYFSTAQLNVLSLSIFLAKALNAKDNDGNNIDCIFLDDPIQSMDSINILSTIDLLRSLSVNYNKQIILSTHEENFFKLLQKKIPSDIFKSKYIELETFGSVKS